MEHLFEPFEFKNLTLKNRIVMPALASFLIKDDGTVTEEAVEHYKIRASGGCAMLIIEACAVSPEGLVSHHQARIDMDRHIKELSKLAKAIAEQDCIPAIQLHHGGRQTSSRIIGRKPLAPSPLPCPTIKGEVEPLTVKQIHEIVKKFGDGAERALEAGFELIEIHGAHGYLINQFLSRFSNIRDDEYGGDIRGRTRFAQEIVREIRNRVGDNFPISFKISAQEFVPNGLTVEESIEILQILVQEGVDIVQVSAGNDATPEWICQPMFMKKACLADYAYKIRSAIDVPVMAVGRINDPMVAEEILSTRKADLVCIGRGLIADPEFPKKAWEGRLDEIRNCIACNTCMEAIFRKGRVECLVNPSLGREKEMELVPTKEPNKIMIVGGGPGGLNVAWVAAARGHDVHLYEKHPELGGQLLLGSVTGYKKEVLNLIKFQKTQVKKYGVKCHLNTEVTPELIEQESPDVVVLATGSVPVMPPVEGIEKSIVVAFDQLLSNQVEPNKKIIVIGGGATGSEVALHLAEYGCQITIVDILPKIGASLESITRKVLLQKLKEKGVTLLPRTELKRITESGALFWNKEKGEFFLESDLIVIAIGTRSDNTLYEQIKSMNFKIYRLGDCLEPRSAKAAILEAAILGRKL